MPSTHSTIAPGSAFPSVTLPKVGGGEVTFPYKNTETLVVVYRGNFCPFCQGTLKSLQAAIKSFEEIGVKVVAVSADKEAEAKTTVTNCGITFDVAYGLEPATMQKMGLFISDPTNYIEQKHKFSEPAWFFVKDDGSVRYLDIGSAPMCARPVPDSIIMAVKWVREQVKTRPEFAKVVWGSAQA
eukprot:341815-Hanusia_phi.AAC.7